MLLRSRKVINYKVLATEGKTMVEENEHVADQQSNVGQKQGNMDKQAAEQQVPPKDSQVEEDAAHDSEQEEEEELRALQTKARALKRKLAKTKALREIQESEAGIAAEEARPPPPTPVSRPPEASTSTGKEAPPAGPAQPTIQGEQSINLGELYAPHATSQNAVPVMGILNQSQEPSMYSQVQAGGPYNQALPGVQTANPYSQVHAPGLQHPSLRVDCDPEAYTYSPFRPTQSKHLSILDFIPEAARHRADDEEELELGPNVRLLTGRKTKLDNVSPAQYMAASAGILSHLLSDPSTLHKVQLAKDYLAHQSKVAVMATAFTWKSVIRWDDEYRRAQNAFNFRWGSDSAHLNLVRLTPREQEPKVKKESKASTKNPPTCFDWNKGASCKVIPCKFRHSCTECGSSDHPRCRHDAAGKQA